MQWPSDLALFTLSIKPSGNIKGVRIRLDDTFKVPIHLSDSASCSYPVTDHANPPFVSARGRTWYNRQLSVSRWSIDVAARLQ